MPDSCRLDADLKVVGDDDEISLSQQQPEGPLIEMARI
ncbi:unnamed protein product [Soboliphyme baturini]|uniref:Transposase n=1 Tax=Soboliphyme baturini TaxID=241478 RepID=A0A183IAL1_9BILA|nr:unnamed protein product [Soboliphyme baturini]